MTDIEALPTEVVTVDPKPTGMKSKVGSEEFIKEFGDIVREGPPWRTAKKLAETLNCDPIDLITWMDKQPALVRRPGKEEGTVYYAVGSRLEQPKEEKRPPGMERKSIEEEDRYVVAMLHQTYSNFATIMEKYGMRIYRRNNESLAKLNEAREAMSAGFALLANTLQIDVTKLPKF